MNPKPTKNGRWITVDKYKLLKLKAGRTKYFVVENVARLERAVSRIHRACEHYRATGKMNDRIFTVTIVTQDEVGVLYGLKKGHTNE